QLSKQYASGLTALHDVSFSVAEGSFTVLLGPSGCGKTTLLKIIGGLLPATAGGVVFDGDTGSELAFVFQDSALMPWRNVRDNVALPLELRRWKRRQRSATAEQLLDLVGLREFADALPRE